ncbi:MAG: MBL fold metallo-hydrolase [Thermotogota bacterium]
MNLKVIGFWGAYPESNSATSCYVVSDENNKLVLDLGSGALSKLMKYEDINKIDDFVITHFHYDHFVDIYPLQFNAMIQQNIGKRIEPINIYTPIDNQYSDTMNYKNSTRNVMYNEGPIFDINGFMVTFIKTNHVIESYAIKIKKNGKTLVYTGDTAWSDKLVEFSKNADLLVSEASLFDGMKGKVDGHMTAGEAGKLANLANVKKLLLTHFPHFGVFELLKKQASNNYGGEIVLAKENLNIKL